MSTDQNIDGGGFSTNEGEDGNFEAFCGSSDSSNIIQSELIELKKHLESKDIEIASLKTQHKIDKEMFESHLQILKEKVHESDSKLTEVQSESEAVFQQNKSDRQELEMMRRRSLMGGGGQILTQMYETILMRYEKLNISHEELRRKITDETNKKIKLQKQLDAIRLHTASADRESLLKQIQLLNDRIENEQRDLARVREERTMIKREYALIMSERDAVHKEMDKMLEDLTKKENQLKEFLIERKSFLEEREKLNNQITSLQHESTSSLDVVSLREELFVAHRERKQALLEKEEQFRETHNLRKSYDVVLENIELMSAERDSLKTKLEQTRQELVEALDEAKKSTRWRELAFHERDKLHAELKENRQVCINLTTERETLMKQLEEAVKENDTTKQAKNEILHELREIKSRTELPQKKNTQSHDSAIDAGEWESEPNMFVQQHGFVYNLKHDDDISIEQGFFVKYCNSKNVLPGDQLIAINNKLTLDKGNVEIQKLLMSKDSISLQLSRCMQMPVGHHKKELSTGSQTTKSELSIPTERIFSPKKNSKEELQISERTALSVQDINKKENVHSTGKKKKMNSSRFMWKKKKPKSVNGTLSTRSSSGGTWPRLSSPSLTNLTAGKLSVFSPNKNRPTISANTFTPLVGKSDGKSFSLSSNESSTNKMASPTCLPLPVTEKLNSRDSLTSTAMLPWQQATSPRPRRTATKYRRTKTRPQSAPMGIKPELSLGSNWNTNHIAQKAHWKQTGNNSVDKRVEQENSISNVPLGKSENDSLGKMGMRISVTDSSLFQIRQQDKSPNNENRKQILDKNKKRRQASKALTLPISHASPSMMMSPDSYQTFTSRQQLANSLTQSYSASISSSISSDLRSRTLEYKRIRIPSEASVVVKLSSSEKGSLSDRSTPIPFLPLNTQGGVTTNDEATLSFLSMESEISQNKKQIVGTDSRYVSMVKGPEPIGISIVSGGDNGGIFVSRLTEHSLAANAGLEYGDQLLEYNGINLRTAKELQARKIMSQSQIGDTITFLAQYNLKKYKQSIESNLSGSLGCTQSFAHSSQVSVDEREERTITPDATPQASSNVEEVVKAQSINQPRYVFINGDCSRVKLDGGNSTGIYVASLKFNEDLILPSSQDLKVGDKILEFNSIKFSNITLEAAYLLMSKPCTSSSLLVIYEPNKYRQIYGIGGDCFYVRALFDNMTEHDGALKFDRNSILLVENTYPEYASGSWIAWLVDELGEKSKKGKIPSRLAVEKERELSSHVPDDISSIASSTGKRLIGTGRRSGFFRSQKRRKPHRTSSRSSGDGHLHTALSETSIESVALDISGVDHLVAYQVVEKHSSGSKRPVVLFGPHCQIVVEKLAREHTQTFVKCYMENIKSKEYENGIIEMYTRSNETRILSNDLLKDVMSQFPERHVLLELSIDAIDRLHAIKIYPIIVFLKYSSAKRVKEYQDKSSGREKLSTKQCKEVLEKANTTERILMSKYYGAVSVNGGPSSFVATKVSKVVSHEHNKVLWLPAKSNPLLS